MKEELCLNKHPVTIISKFGGYSTISWCVLHLVESRLQTWAAMNYESSIQAGFRFATGTSLCWMVEPLLCSKTAATEKLHTPGLFSTDKTLFHCLFVALKKKKKKSRSWVKRGYSKASYLEHFSVNMLLVLLVWSLSQKQPDNSDCATRWRREIEQERWFCDGHIIFLTIRSKTKIWSSCKHRVFIQLYLLSLSRAEKTFICSKSRKHSYSCLVQWQNWCQMS